MWFIWLAASFALDPREVVREAVKNELRATGETRNYIYRYRQIDRKANGTRVSKDHTYETTILYGRPFVRWVEKDGKALEGKAAANERARFESAVNHRARKSLAERTEEDRRELDKERGQREFLAQIPDLYDFQWGPETLMEGRKVWEIAAKPRAGARPRGLAARNLSQLTGKLWIDQEERRWVRVEAEAKQPIRFGWILGRIAEGSHVTFDQSRMSDGIWLPKRVVGRLKARFVVAPFDLESETNYFGYRRFAAESVLRP
jgi:hypothetical protein